MASPQPVQAEKPKRTRRQWIMIAVAVVAIVLVGTYLAVEYFPNIPPSAPAAPNVVIWNGIACSYAQNCGFVPNVRTISVGTTVFWMNNGGMTHTVTTCDNAHSVSQCPAMDASGLDSWDAYVIPGTSFSHTFNSAGHFYYYCKPHPWMQGEIIVQ